MSALNRFLFWYCLALSSFFTNASMAQMPPDDELPPPPAIQSTEDQGQEKSEEKKDEVPLDEDGIFVDEGDDTLDSPPRPIGELNMEPQDNDAVEKDAQEKDAQEKDAAASEGPMAVPGFRGADHDEPRAKNEEFDAEANAPPLPLPEMDQKTAWSKTSFTGGMIGCGISGGITGAATAVAYFFGGVLLVSALQSSDACSQACGLAFGYGFIVIAGGLLALIHGVVAPLGALVGVAIATSLDDDKGDAEKDRIRWLPALWGFLPGILGGLIAVAPLAFLPFTNEFGSDALYPILIGGVVTSAVGASIAATSGIVAIVAASSPPFFADDVEFEESPPPKEPARRTEANASHGSEGLPPQPLPLAMAF